MKEYPSYETLINYIESVSGGYERYVFNYTNKWAIINLEYLTQIEKGEYDKDKVKVIEENKTLKRKLKEIQNILPPQDDL